MSESDFEQGKTQAIFVLTPGALMAHYRIVRPLGSGGMGEVFLAEDTRLKRQVALKFLSPGMANDETLRQRFMREAQAAAALNHPNIVTVYEVSQHQGRVFIAMEYVEGQSLRELIDQGKLTLEWTIRIMLQVCDGLASAHAAGLVHRDIKPLNIMVDARDRVRILDFGLAKASGDQQLTQAGLAIGTVDYMSPEQSQGLEADRRSDIFSVGIVLYEMMTGRLPFKKANIPATLHAILHEEPAPLAEACPGVSVQVATAVERALAKDPTRRYQEIDELKRDLQAPENGSRTMAVSARTAEVAAGKPAPTPQVRSLAVLHLRNLGAADDDFLCYGITEDLIVDLTRIGTIRVTPMRSIMKFKDSDADFAEIGSLLGVDVILDGSIMKSPTALRISAQLVESKSGKIVWAERWEEKLENLPLVKKSLADGVSQFFNVGATIVRRAEIGLPDTADAQAYELYLKAKYTFERKQSTAEVDIALGLHRQALHKEPGLLSARAGVVEILIHQGQFDQAQTEVVAALAEARSQRRLPEQAHLLRLQARLFARQSLWHDASLGANEALDLSRGLGDLDGEAEAIGVLIAVLQPQGRFDDSLMLFDRVLEISRRLDDQDKIAEALKNMGVAYSRKGDYSRATELYEEALEIAKKLENQSLQAACYANIGNLHYYQGDLDQAFKFHGQALEIDSRLGDRAGAARHNLNMGLVQLQRGNQQAGLKLLQTSAHLFEALGDRSNLAMTLSNVSQARLQLGEVDLAIEAAERALTIGTEINHPLSAASAHQRLAAAYSFTGDNDTASNHMHVALEIARENHLSRNVAALEGELARLHYLKGEDDAADKHARRAQTNAREIGDKLTMCAAGAYQAALSARSGLYHSARSQLVAHLRKAQEIGDSDLVAHVEILLSEALLKYGDDTDKAEARHRFDQIQARLHTSPNASLTKQIKDILSVA